MQDLYAYGYSEELEGSMGENGEGDWRLSLFYDNAPSGRHGTMTYLAKGTVLCHSYDLSVVARCHATCVGLVLFISVIYK